MDAVCALLDVNDCLQAADYEPLEETVNKDSYAKLASTKWDNYPYSAILVLGYGPEEANVPVSAIGKMRAAYAVQLYRDHQAPFIILSGGRVHPDHTPYSEANEMKKYLIETWLCKVSYKKKTVFWLSVWKGYFQTGFFFTQKHLEKIAALDIDETVKGDFFNRKPVGKLFPMIFKISQKEQLNDLLKVVAFKKDLK